MPYQNAPVAPRISFSTRVFNMFSGRTLRQVLLVDLPLTAMILYLPVAGLILAPHLGVMFNLPIQGSYLNLFIVWLRVILPVLVLLGCLLYLLRTARKFLLEIHNPVSRKDVEARIWNRLFGIDQVMKPEALVISGTDLNASDHWSKWLGGPAWLLVYDGFAAYLEYGNTFGRVVGAGVPIPILDSRETIKTIVDLRPQIREFEINGWTKDGIKVHLGVRMECRIGSDYTPEKADPHLLYPFDPDSVKRAVEYTAVRLRDDKLTEVDWSEGARGKVQGLLAHHISSRRLDELVLTERGDGQVLSNALMKKMLEDANHGLKESGVHVSSIQVTRTLVPEDVYGQRLDVWKAGREKEVSRIQGETRAYEIRVEEEACARAQRELIVSIARGLGNVNPQQIPQITLLSLSKVLDQGLKDPLVRNFMNREALNLLESLKLLR